MGGFLGALLGGSNPTLGETSNRAGQVAGFGTSLGEGNLTNASNFYNTLLGGNQAQQAQLLAPEIQGIQQQGQQQLERAAQFGNRGGGTNAAAQQNIDTQRANSANMISQLTGGAASGAANLGQNALNTGLNANQQQAALSQEQLQNFQNSILGGALSGAVGNLGTGLSGMGSGLIGF